MSAVRPKLAVLIACHNRVAHTLRCVQALTSQGEAGVDLHIYLVDDGSSDGTAEAVSRMPAEVRILRGDGSLFWGGAIRLAFEHAMLDRYDYYLWLNDDTCLDPDALARMIMTHRALAAKTVGPVIVVGSTRDPDTGEFTYGGWRACTRRLGPTTWEKVPPDMEAPIDCDTFNGNCVLIPANAATKVGNIDPVFRHGLGDIDYGLRAARMGCRLVVAAGYFGTCTHNKGHGSWIDRSLPVLTRWRKLLGPKGLPFRAWWVFTRRHKGNLWLLSWVAPYVLIWFDVLRSGRNRGD